MRIIEIDGSSRARLPTGGAVRLCAYLCFLAFPRPLLFAPLVMKITSLTPLHVYYTHHTGNQKSKKNENKTKTA